MKTIKLALLPLALATLAGSAVAQQTSTTGGEPASAAAHELSS